MTSSQSPSKAKLVVAACAIIAGAFANSLGSLASMAAGSPFFFDSIFTALAGALFGPWAGLLCALFTHVFLTAFHRWEIAWMFFLPCSMATGAIVGAFARKERLRGAFDFILCAMAVTLSNSLIGAVIAAYAFGGITVHPSDYLITGLLLAGQSVLSASFWARIPLNLIDKSIAVTAALGAFNSRLFREWRAGSLGGDRPAERSEP